MTAPASVDTDKSAGTSASSAGEPAPSVGVDDPGLHRTGQSLYLIGRPPLKLFLRYVTNHALGAPGDGALIERWHKAAAVVNSLQEEEAGAADNPRITNLGPEYEPLLREFLKDPLVHQGFNAVPTEVALVELDQLVVHQEHIDVTFADELEKNIGPAPGRDELFRVCLPYDHPPAPASWTRHYDKFVFVSPSNDLRFLGPMPLKAPNIVQTPHPGCIFGVVGLAVGFGSNFLNAICAEGRLILDNGSHRAFALRRMGITHVPCIIQHVSSREELEVVASTEVRRNADRYLSEARPPMLKDYLNPDLHMVMTVQRRLRQVTVRFEVEEDYSPVL